MKITRDCNPDMGFHSLDSPDDATAMKGWSKNTGHDDIEDEVIATTSR